MFQHRLPSTERAHHGQVHDQSFVLARRNQGRHGEGRLARAEAIEKLASGVGGSVESVYFSFGSDDLYAIVDAPSHEAMAAIAGTVGQTGAVSKYETVVLLTPAQIDEASNMKVDYTPPGT